MLIYFLKIIKRVIVKYEGDIGLEDYMYEVWVLIYRWNNNLRNNIFFLRNLMIKWLIDDRLNMIVFFRW